MTVFELKQEFVKVFGGTAEDVRVFTAPGRVNLIGDHTDYNGGYVLPIAISMKTFIACRTTNDGFIRMRATDIDDCVDVDIKHLNDYRDLKWGNYQVGVAYELERRGYEIVGCQMLYHDELPHGAGLSSSAAIEVATALLLATLSNEKRGIKDDINMVEMALCGQGSESNYCGVNCGIMDQFASAMGKKNNAIFLDCEDLSFTYVPINISGYKIVISNTNKKNELANIKYNERKSECDAGFEFLKGAGASSLGKVTPEQFEKLKILMTNDVIRKRTEHVVYECDRVKRSVTALKGGGIFLFGRLMSQSHNSLRDLYEVSSTELDILVEEALKTEGCIGSRMTGGGFGGCTVSIVKEENVEEFIKTVGNNYRERIGCEATFYISDITDGACEIV